MKLRKKRETGRAGNEFEAKQLEIINRGRLPPATPCGAPTIFEIGKISTKITKIHGTCMKLYEHA